MKKHIFGLAIFSFIVFAAAFVYGVFHYSGITIADTTSPDSIRSENISSNVVQAVYSVRTKRLSWQGNLPNEKKATHLDLWAANGNRFDYIGSVPVKKLKDENVYAFDELISSLNKITPSVNLYLIVETEDHLRNRNFEPYLEFDVQHAVPVTIDYSK